MKTFFGWFFGVIFAMAAAGSIINGEFVAVAIFAVWSLICLPPVHKLAQQRGLSIHPPVRVIIFLAGFILVNLSNPDNIVPTPVAEQSPTSIKSPSAIASTSPQPTPEKPPTVEAANQPLFGFDQELTRVHAAYGDSGFFAEWSMDNSQLELVRRDDTCNLRAWKLPEDQMMRGLQVNFRAWTPECANALQLAVTTLAPDVDYSAIEQQVSDFSLFVKEVDAAEVVTLDSSSATLIEAIWVDNGSSCPVGSCDLSIQIEQTDSN